MGSTRLHAVSRDWGWFLPLCAVTAAQFVLWWVIWSFGHAPAPLLTLYGTAGLFSISVAFVIRFLVWLLKRRGVEPHTLVSVVCFAVAGALVGSLQSSSFSALKQAIPSVAPFWADAPLQSFDSALHVWKISHALFGGLTPAIDTIYATWGASLIIATAFLFTAPASALKTRAINSFTLAWLLLGVIGAYLFSSAGPIFIDPQIKMRLASEGAKITLREASYLSAHSSGGAAAAAGISAMPSLHVAMAIWLALVVSGWLPRLKWIGWSYAGLIWLGSVHLGWHYLSDGVVGALGMMAIWMLIPYDVNRTPTP